MGIAASQGLLLQLTARNHSIGFELQDLSNQKVRLSSEMQKISRNYQDSLNRKVLKWSNNSGVSYMDLSYANLMKPSAMNKNKAYLLTDPEGRVVVDNQYKKYAEMISPNGAPGGDWEGNRTAILAEITGIDASKIDSANSYQEAIWENDEIIQELMHKEPNKNKFTENNISDLLKKAGSSTGCSATFSSGEDWASAYENSDATISLGAGASAVSNLNGVLDHLSNSLSKYFLDDADKFSQAVEEIRNEYRGLIESNSDQSKSASGLRGNSSEYKINVSTIIDEILGHYGNLGGESTEAEYNGKKQYLWYDIDTEAYSNWQAEHDTWQAEYDTAVETYNNSVNSNNQLLTAEEEALINFYDEIFSAIAEKGWTYNNQVSDTDYLNQMLQNGIYTITTVDRNLEYDIANEEYTYENDYSTDIASNFSNIFTVSDSDAREDAQIEYEYQKSIISAKESRIDTRMADLQTEQSTIKTRIESIEKLIGENIDRTFKIMS